VRFETVGDGRGLVDFLNGSQSYFNR